ncbi:MAG: NAD(P)-binding protein, partial [Nitrospira sp.]|nr:NAD(P)-binding protein [Nitrospira sp.]
MTAHTRQTILILGAGLTGLAVGHFLTQQGHHVTLLDYPSWQDGYGTDAPDAAPALFGRYRETWRLLHAIDNGSASQTNHLIPLEFRLPDGHIAPYRSTRLPGALQWVTSLLSFHGLARHDRWKLLSYLEQMWEQAQPLPADLDNRLAGEWLASIGQSPEACRHIWNPLSRWLSGNALEQLSAAVFVQQLSALFLGRATDARLTYLHGTVGDRLISPLKQQLEKHGSQILPQIEAPLLRFGANGLTEIRLHDGSLLQAQRYITALPHRKLLSLLPESLLTRYAYFAQLSELESMPEIAVSFTQSSPRPVPRLILCAERPFHLLTVSPSGASKTLCRFSAVGNPALMELSDQQLLDLGRAERRLLCQDSMHDEHPTGTITRHHQAALS